MATRRNIPGEELLDRPLTARSVIASLLLGRHPPAAPVGLLVRWCAEFGVSATAARVALSRMVERGELAAAHGVYSLVGRIRERQSAQDFALMPALRDWDGDWALLLVGTGDEARPAADRAALRAALIRARTVPLREGVWIRPDNLPEAATTEEDRAVIGAQAVRWSGRPTAGWSVPDLVASFGVADHSRRGQVLLARLDDVNRRLPDLAVLAEGFVVGAAVVQHLRRDPLLPAELLPAAWPGDDLRRAYADYRGRFGRAITIWSAR